VCVEFWERHTVFPERSLTVEYCKTRLKRKCLVARLVVASRALCCHQPAISERSWAAREGEDGLVCSSSVSQSAKKSMASMSARPFDCGLRIADLLAGAI